MVHAAAEKVISTIPADTRAKAEQSLVKNLSLLRGVSLKATSKIHRFKPSASLTSAIQWVAEQEQQGIHTLDFTLIFDSGSAMNFQQGSYKEFEALDDED